MSVDPAAGQDGADDGVVLVSRIIIERVLLDDGSDIVRWEATGGDGSALPMLEQVGMLYMTLDGALHAPQSHHDDENADGQ